MFEDVEDAALEPEDDWVVPGGANDSLSPNTKLGQAIRCVRWVPNRELPHGGGREVSSLPTTPSRLYPRAHASQGCLR